MRKVNVTKRNQLCHCGSNVKYKKCCLLKDLNLKRKNELVMKICRNDFIGGPFKTCPKCKMNTFGVFISTKGNRYSRECKNCHHTANFTLPPIKKKIIYLDQFFISNMTKALDSKSKGHKKALAEPFWIEAYKLLNTLVNLNLIVCPDSTFHSDESLLCGDPSYSSLKRIYEHLSTGATFYDQDTVNRFQIQQSFENYLNGELDKDIVIEPSNIIHGEPHDWTGGMIISVNMKPYEGQLDAIHKQRNANYEGMKTVFKRWQEEKGRKFEDWYKEEANAFGKGTIEMYLKHIKKQQELPIKYAEQLLNNEKPNIDLDDILPSPSAVIITEMLNKLKFLGFEEMPSIKKVAEYLKSDYVTKIPNIHISSLLYAGLARKAASGQKEYPNRGTYTDVSAVSHLMPYCDAIFIDNPMFALLNESPINQEIKKYNTRVFSLNKKAEFIKYLNDIKNNANQDHIDLVHDYRGEPSPYLTILNDSD